MDIIQIIDKKRQGLPHSPEEIRYLVQGAMAGTIPDYQLSAWLMAVCLKGLDLEETTALTQCYVESGQVLDFSEVQGIIVDKHSTGGVGDKTTLILAPLLASCGVNVAKLSGRGLGYTGGTVDKLEAIPQFNVSLPTEQFLCQVNSIGVALCSQTGELAPADGLFYALRDVTATVASIPLIAASVVSKKIAAGAQVITLDIKVGEGAFMKTLDEAKSLALACREVGKRLGRSISTVISRMDQPLGNAIGHTVEVIESIETLKGRGPKDLQDLCLVLGAVALVDAGTVPNLEAGKADLMESITSGRALEKFRALIQAQGGDSQVLDDYSRFPHPQHYIEVKSPASGYIEHCHALKIAQAAKVLGAGRLSKSAPIDLSVGVVVSAKQGDAVQKGQTLATLWANEMGVEEAKKLIQEAYTYSERPPIILPLVEDIFLATEPVTKPSIKACI